MDKEKVNEILEQLTDEEKAVVAKYPILLELTKEKLRELCYAIINGDWQPAYRIMAEQKSTDDIIAELKSINESIEAWNADNATNIAEMKNFFKEILSVAGAILLSLM